jgi:hypothetical protein
MPEYDLYLCWSEYIEFTICSTAWLWQRALRFACTNPTSSSLTFKQV